MTKKRYAIGVDPGAETGYAVWDRSARTITQKRTTDFWTVMLWAEGGLKDDAFFVVEVPTLKRIYARNDDHSDVARVRENMSHRMGSNCREAELLAEGLERLGFEIRRVTPQRSKLDAKEFARVTGIKERTNQHIRDAVMLVWKM